MRALRLAVVASMLQVALTACPKTHALVGARATFPLVTLHRVAGTAEVIDDCTIKVTDFTYDGTGPSVWMYGFKTVGDISNRGSGIFLEGPGEGTRVKRAYNREEYTIDIVGHTLDDFSVLSVWCVRFNQDFGHVVFTAPVSTSVPTAIPTAIPTSVPTAVPTLAPTLATTSVPGAVSMPTPEPTAEPTSVPTAVPTTAPTARATTHALVGAKSTFPPGTQKGVAGTAEVIDDRTIKLANFSYDGTGPSVWMYGFKKVSDITGGSGIFLEGPGEATRIKRAFNNEEYTINIVGHTLDDFSVLSVWCVRFNQDFGHVVFMAPTTASTPAPGPVPTPAPTLAPSGTTERPKVAEGGAYLSPKTWLIASAALLLAML